MPEVQKDGEQYATDSITADSDIIDYLSDNPSQPVSGNRTLMKYMSIRDFGVEPLSTRAAAFLLQEKYTQIHSHRVDEYSIKSRIDVSETPVYPFVSTLNKWGYEIRGVDSDAHRSGVIIHAVRSPHTISQLRALMTMPFDAPIDVLIDNAVLNMYNQFVAEDDQIPLDDWVEYRSVSRELIMDNLSKGEQLVAEYGGVPGTQQYIRNNGGVTFDT